MKGIRTHLLRRDKNDGQDKKDSLQNPAGAGSVALALVEPTQHIIAILLRKERAHAAESIVEHFPWIVRCLLCIILNLFLNVTERLWFADCIRCVRVGLRVGLS